MRPGAARRAALWALCLCLLLSGCAGTEGESRSQSQSQSESQTQTGGADRSGQFSQRDGEADFDADGAVQILLQGDSASASSDSVLISGGRVTLTQEACYVVSGSLDEGMLLVDADENAKLQIVLDGAEICSSQSAALYVRSADKVFLTLAPGSENRLENGGSFAALDENNIDGALFSKADLSLNGAGSLRLISPAGHGLVCKDDLVVLDAGLQIQAAGHGLDANDSIRIGGAAALEIQAGQDGLHCENSDDASLGYVYVESGSLTLEAQGDGISAGAWAQVLDGRLDICAGGGAVNGSRADSGSYGGFPGGHGGPGMGGPGMGGPGWSQEEEQEEDSVSMKGIKSVGLLTVAGGSLQIDAADDGLHSDSSMEILGGQIAIATGDDGLHAEDSLRVSGGSIHISESYEGLEALHLSISGGEISLVASDDGLNAAGGVDGSGYTGGRDGMFGGPGMGGSSDGSILISGGSLSIRASGDGIDANGSLSITGGSVLVCGPTQGDTAILDYDTQATITGGSFLGTGALGMAQSFSGGSQGLLAISVGQQPAGTAVALYDAAGSCLLSHSPADSFALLILSCPEMVTGESYTVTVGELSGEFVAN